MQKSDNNRECRVSWESSHGLEMFQGKAVVDLQVGDILVMDEERDHGVYTPEDSLLIGTHFVLAEMLARVLRTSTFHKNNPDYANDPSPRVREYFQNFIEVLNFSYIANYKLTKTYINQDSRPSEAWGFWDYLEACYDLRKEWGMTVKKIKEAKAHLESLFGLDLAQLSQSNR